MHGWAGDTLDKNIVSKYLKGRMMPSPDCRSVYTMFPADGSKGPVLIKINILLIFPQMEAS